MTDGRSTGTLDDFMAIVELAGSAAKKKKETESSMTFDPNVAHEIPMMPACKPNLLQLSSLGLDLDLYLKGKTQM